MAKKIKVAKKKVKSKKKDVADKKPLTLAELLITNVTNKFGDESVMRLDGMGTKPVPVSFAIGIDGIDDDLLGIGGIPMSRIIEVIGPESSGKTTLCLHMAAAVQKAGGTVAFIDAEHALDTKYATDLKVDIPKLILNQPTCGEEAMEITEMMLRTKQKVQSQEKPLLIIVDSVAALTPRAEIDGTLEDNNAGLGAHARLMSTSLRRLLPAMKGTNAVVVFTNQIRMKIGIRFGSPETTPGGNALKFYASLRLDIRSIGKEKVGDEVIGNKFRLKTIKNKTFPPFREFTGLIRFGIGIDIMFSKFATMKEQKILKQKAAWYSMDGIEKKFCGYNGFKSWYNENSEQIEAKLNQNS